MRIQLNVMHWIVGSWIVLAIAIVGFAMHYHRARASVPVHSTYTCYLDIGN